MRVEDQLSQGGIYITKIKDPLKYAVDALKMGGFTFRERFNAYAGTIGGMIGSVIAMRYLIFSPASDENFIEIAEWAYSLSALPVGLLAGAGLGAYTALKMRNARKEREKERREKVTCPLCTNI